MDIMGKVINTEFHRKPLHRSPETEVVIMWGYGERVVTELDSVIRIAKYLGNTWVLLAR